jgi:hypothetical protein
MADFTLSAATEAELQRWDDLVAAEPGATLFHRMGWLRAAAEESRTRLMPLVARAEQHPVAFLPVFLKSRMGIRALFSPPPGCAIPVLGPVFCGTRKRQRGKESFSSALANAIGGFLAEERVHHTSVTLHHSLSDVRPFLWQGFSAHVSFDYVVSVAGTEDSVFANFESEARTKIRRAQKHENVRIADGGVGEALQLLEMLRRRYAEQGRNWTLSTRYLRAVFNAVPAEAIGVKVAMAGDRILTGMITLYYDDMAQDWIGGFSPVEPLSGINELLHWSIIQEAKARGLAYYDLGGANTSHLSRSKAKYNPSLRQYFRIERASLFARAVKEVMTSPIGRAVYGRLK